MRALVTGITGQDGGYLAERLVADGYDVHGLVHAGDAAVAALRERCPSVQLHTGDLQDGASLAAAVAAADPDEVYNLAGISSVAFSWEQPVLTADITALGAARLLDEVRLLQARRRAASGSSVRFVQASSAEIFGAASGVQDEATPLAPTSPYGAAKAYAHQLCGLYRSVGVFASSLVLFNHESPRRPPTFVTRKITQTVARISQGLESELVLGNLDARRDWGWAPDYVDAMVRAARASAADDFVIATGEAHSVRDFALAAFARVGIADGEARIRVDPALVRPGDPPVLVGNAAKARTVLGWSPTVAFAELVGRMVDRRPAGVTTRPPRTFGLVQWVCGFFAFVVAVFAVPLGAIDARDHRAAVALEKDGTWHDVVQVREHVVRQTSRTSVSYGVDRVEVTYDGGVVLVRGLRSPPAPEEHEGWYVTYRAAPGQPAQRVRVGAKGAFLEDDYEHVLRDPDRALETDFVVWVLFWSSMLVLTTVVRRRRQIAAGHTELAPARVLAVRTVAGVVALFVAIFLFSFLLEHLTYPR